MRWSIRCADKNTLEVACLVHLNLLLLNRQLLPPGRPGVGETWVNIVLAISKIVVYCLQYGFLQRNTYKYLWQRGPWQQSMWREKSVISGIQLSDCKAMMVCLLLCQNLMLMLRFFSASHSVWAVVGAWWAQVDSLIMSSQRQGATAASVFSNMECNEQGLCCLQYYC